MKLTKYCAAIVLLLSLCSILGAGITETNTPANIALTRMDLVVDGYALPSSLESLTSTNATVAALKSNGALLCAWVAALAHDATPPEQLPVATAQACATRVVDLARLADACAYKATAIGEPEMARKIGPKAKTLPELLEALYAWSTVLRLELQR